MILKKFKIPETFVHENISGWPQDMRSPDYVSAIGVTAYDCLKDEAQVGVHDYCEISKRKCTSLKAEKDS